MLRFLKQQHIKLLISLLAGLVCLVTFTNHVFTANAAPNLQINYQGKLTDDLGATVADGVYNFAFNLYQDNTTIVWSSTTTVPVTNGLFSYLLGSSTPLTGVDFNQNLYLSVNIGGTGAPSWDGEMTPRKLLGSVPSAFEAQNAQTLDNLATSSFLRSDQADTATGLITLAGGASTTDLVVSDTVTTTNAVINNNLTVSGTASTTNQVISNNVTLSAITSGILVTNNTGVVSASTSLSDGFISDDLTIGANSTLANNVVTTDSVLSSGQVDGYCLTYATGDNWSWQDCAAAASNYFTQSGSSTYLTGLQDNLGIGTTTASSKLTVYGDAFFEGSNRYLNFGTTTGSSGYGFRDNGGTLEFKNAGGQWNSVTTATSGPAFSVNRNGSNQTISTGSNVDIDWTNEEYDTNNNFDLSTDRFTPTVAGKYVVTLTARCITSTRCNVNIAKNGTNIAFHESDGDNSPSATVSTVVDMNGTTDYLTAKVYSLSTTLSGNTQDTFFTGAMISTAVQTAGGWDDNGAYVTLTDNTDSVGIGTSTPTAKLDIYGSGNSDIFAVSSSSNTRLFTITSSGNIGIGTTTPEAALEIFTTGTSFPDGWNSNLKLTGVYPGLWLHDTTTNDGYVIGQDVGKLYFGYEDNGLITGGDIVFDSSGYIGIGTTSPISPLDIFGSIPRITFFDSDAGAISSSQPVWAVRSSANDGGFRIQTTADRSTYTDRLYVSNQGYVGIGTSTPTELLTIEGNSPVTSYYATNNNRGAEFGIEDGFNAVVNSIGGSVLLKNSGTTWMNVGANGLYTLFNQGSVGIGTSTPTAKLDIYGSGNSDIFAVSSSSNSRLFTITSSGNVGIGTTTPSASGSWDSPLVEISGTIPALKLTETDSASNDFILGVNGGVFNILENGVAVRMVIDGSGNIGIGTSTPAGKLGILGTGEQLRLSYSGTAYSTLSTDSSGRLIIDTSGDIFRSLDTIESGSPDNIAGTLAANGDGSGVAGGSLWLRTSADYDTTIDRYAFAVSEDDLYIGPSSDTDALFYNGGTGNWAFTAGNVGIGTTSPYAKLSVAGHVVGQYFTATSTATSTFPTIYVNGQLYDSTGKAGASGYVLQSNGTSVSWVATSSLNITGGGGSGTVGSGTTGQFAYYASDGTTLTATSSLFISSSGRIGIGTSSPASKLDVWGDFRVGTSGTPTLFVDASSGYVGIGTTTPDNLLDIYGTVAGAAASAVITNLSSTGYAEIGATNDAGAYGVLSTYGSGHSLANQTIVGTSNDLVLNTNTNVQNGGSGEIRFMTGGWDTSTQQRMVIDANGKVGIGTSTPLYSLVIGDGNATDAQVYISGGAGVADASARPTVDTSQIILGRGTVSEGGGIEFNLSPSGSGYGWKINAPDADSRQDLRFFNRHDNATWSEVLTLQGNTGNVGIGTTTPNANLQIAGSAGQSQALFRISSSSNQTLLKLDADGAFSLSWDTDNDYPTFFVDTWNEFVGIGTSTNFYAEELVITNDYTGSSDTLIAFINETDVFKAGINDGNFAITDSGENELLTVTSAGLVGIGTTTPSAPLHIDGSGGLLELSGAGAFTKTTISNRATDGDPVLVWELPGTRAWMAGIDDGDSDKWKLASSESTDWSGTLLTVTTAGNVGIGTTTPASKLDVWGNLTVGTSSTPALFVNTESGNVGIGGAGDGAYNKFTVFGSSGQFKFNNIGDTLSFTRAGTIYFLASNASGQFAFQTGGSGTDVLIDPSGNVGLGGDTSPDFRLETSGTSTKGYFGISSDTGNDGDILTVDVDGYVGIGTTSPASKLDLWSDSSTSGNALSVYNSAGTSLFNISNTGTTTIGDPNGTGNAVFQFAGNSNAWSTGYYDTDKSFRIASSTSLTSNVAFTILKGGNVGIGSTTPSEKLVVAGNIAPSANLTYDLGAANLRWADVWAETLNVGTSTWSIFNGSNGRFAISNAAQQGGTEALSILTTGEVGIGTTTPTAALTVKTSGTTDILNLFETGGSEILTVLESGYIGYGLLEPDNPVDFNASAPDVTQGTTFSFYGNLDSTSNDQFGLWSTGDVGPSSASSRTYAGLVGEVDSYLNTTDLQNATLIGTRGASYIAGTGSFGSVMGGNFYLYLDAAGTISNGYGITINDASNNGGTINQLYGLAIDPQTQGTNNNIGIMVGESSGGTDNVNFLLGTTTLPTGNFSLFSGSGYDSYFEGAVGIGTTSPVGRLTVTDDNLSLTWQEIGSSTPISGTGSAALTTMTTSRIAFIDSAHDELRTYEWDGTSWTQAGSGLSVSVGSMSLTALSPNVIALASNVIDEIRTYEWDGAAWSELGDGLSIAGVGLPSITKIGSNQIAYFDSTAQELRAYEWDGSTWYQIGTSTTVSGSGFGYITALLPNQIAFIDSTNDELRTYKWNGSTWSRLGSGLSIPSTYAIGLQTLSPKRVAFVEALSDTIRTYDWNGTTWTQVGSNYSLPSFGFAGITAVSSNRIVFIDNGASPALETYQFASPLLYIADSTDSPLFTVSDSGHTYAASLAVNDYFRVGPSGNSFTATSAPSFIADGVSVFTGLVGIGTSSPSAQLTIAGNNTALTNQIFTIASSTGSTLFTVTDGGNVGIGTTSPWKDLSVDGDVSITGSLFDSNGSAGTAGMVLQSTGSGFQWVSTSSLGITGSVYAIWAEENAALGDGTYEWAFGNGADTPNGSGITIAEDSELYAFSYELIGTISGAEIAIEKNGVINKTSGSISANSGVVTFATTTTFSSGDEINFYTITAGGATAGRVTAWFRTAGGGGGEASLWTQNGSDIYYNTGNVGIGTSTPTEALSIWGNILLSSSTANSITGNQYLTLQSAGGTFGPTSLTLQNEVGSNGPIFSTLGSSVNLIDFGFIPGSATQQNIRLEARPTQTNGGNDSEFQIGIAADPTFIIGTTTSALLYGNFGIGTTTPTSLLQVELPAWSDRDDDTEHVVFGSGGTGFGLRFGYDPVANIGTINALQPTVAWGDLILQDGIGGNVGIGTTTPDTKLTVDGNVKVDGNITAVTPNSDYLYYRFIEAPISNVHLDPASGFHTYLGYYNGGNTYMGFSGGNVAIGTTASLTAKLTVDATTQTAAWFESNNGYYVIRVKEDGGDTCDLVPSSFGLSDSCSSDEKLKFAITDATSSALTYFDLYRIRNFQMKADGPDGPVNTGVIAQEMLEAHPDLVTMGDDGFYKVATPNPYLFVKAIQELDARTEVISNISATTSSLIAEDNTFWDKLVKLAQGFVDGVLEIAGLKTNEICLTDDAGETCIDRAQLNALISGQSTNSNTSNKSGNQSPTPSTNQTTPEPEPAPTTSTTTEETTEPTGESDSATSTPETGTTPEPETTIDETQEIPLVEESEPLTEEPIAEEPAEEVVDEEPEAEVEPAVEVEPEPVTTSQ